MNKNWNIKIRPAYKAMALAALLGIAGCGEKREHKNVILNISNTEDQAWVLMRDIKTGTERLYKYCTNKYKMESLPYYFNLLENGDTVVISPRSLYKDSYDNKTFLKGNIFKLSYDEKLIKQRADIREFAVEVEKMNIAKRYHQNGKLK